MKRRRLAILGGGGEQVVAVKTAKGLGYGTIAVDDNPEAPAKGVADLFITTKIKDVEGLIGVLRPYNISGIMTHAAELAVETAQVAEALNLPGISKETADLGTFKHLRIKRFDEWGLNVPSYRIIDGGKGNKDEGVDEWIRSAASLGYPLVAKPTGGKGAAGVLLIKDEAELTDYYNNVRDTLKSDFYVLEEYLPGEQFSTETVISKGTALRHNIAYRHYEGMERYHPYLIEDGHSMPVDIDGALRKKIEVAIGGAAEALGVRDGIIKGDILVDGGGRVYLIEMAVRSSGGRFADFVTVKQCGVNILHAMVQMAMGDDVDEEPLREKFSSGVSQRFIFLDEGMTVGEMPDLDDIRSTYGLLEIVFTDRFLRELRQDKIRSHGDRIGYVICSGEDRGEADRLALRICDIIRERMLASKSG